MQYSTPHSPTYGKTVFAKSFFFFVGLPFVTYDRDKHDNPLLGRRGEHYGVVARLRLSAVRLLYVGDDYGGPKGRLGRASGNENDGGACG